MIYTDGGGSGTGFGNGGGPRYPEYFQCTRLELKLVECESFNETASRSAGTDVGLYCNLRKYNGVAEVNCICCFTQLIVLMVRLG